MGEGMATMKMKVSYNGAPFSGFARQPGQSTVQGELERALQILLHREVLTVCAGRTDAGVHAIGQVVSFDMLESELEERSFERMMQSINAITADGIVARDLERAPDGFSARFDAKSREYHYFFRVGETPALFMGPFSWHIPERLDVQAMEDASRCLIGEHDFKSFCLKASAIGKPTCRNLMEVGFTNECIMGEDLLCMKVVGSSFLHSMVRTIAGTLVAVGRGRQPGKWVAEVLEARDREAAGESAPAQGLVFWDVAY